VDGILHINFTYPIKAIVFDFVGVLLCRRPDYQPEPLVEAVDAVIGQVVDDNQFKTAILHDYKLSEEEFVSILQSVVEKYIAYQPLWELLPELRKHYLLAIINNGTWQTYSFFNARFNLEQTFDLFISSAREGIAKPDERIYQRACQKLRLAATECLFMDDSLENIIPAQRIGMQGIHWLDHEQGYKQFLEYLRETGNE
jgi:HAD superfamily hydrolase (TIGR01509 family)